MVASRRAESGRPVHVSPGPWVITIPAPCPWLTDNDRRHHMAQARLVREWRNAAYAAALRTRPPRLLDRVRVDCLFRWATSPVKELDNVRATRKACVDGAVGSRRGTAVGYGIVIDDSDRHVEYGYVRAELIEVPPARLALNPHAGELILTVTDLSGEVAS